MRNDSKSDSSGSGSVSGSGLRRSTRSNTNSSPASVRKSLRLENRPVEQAKCEMADKTLRQIADETRAPTPNRGLKRKKRLDARQFKAMFDLKKTPVSETRSKKRKLEFNSDNPHNGEEGISENSRKDVDSGVLRSEEGLQVERDEHGESATNSDQGLQQNCHEDANGESDGSGEGNMETDCANNTDAGNVTNMKAIPSESPTCKAGSFTEDTAKCSNKPRLDQDSPKQECCVCISNSMSCGGSNIVSQDRGECSNARVEDGQKTNRSDSLVDSNQDSCFSCKRAGNLLRCSGKSCQRSYCLSCLRTREKNTHIPIWYCSECMKKKLALGVHSVSEGIEAVLDTRKVDLSNSEGSLCKNEYYVKYKGLAHIHNCWIPDTQLRHEAPELLTKLSEQGTSWNPEWAVPQRLLSRRLVIVGNQDAGFASKSHFEWLVKWRGLDYDQATWELEDSEFCKKPEVQQLMQEYGTRDNGSKISFILGDDETQERRKTSQVKHGRVLDSYRAEIVSKLREFYQKSHNAVLFDEQDRIMKIIYFISSILSNVHRPLLIITPHESLSNWEAEFIRVAASINVVVYSGNADSRNIIRNTELYREDSELMMQVLISNVEAISEDLEHIKGIDWEAIIVDDCQEHCFVKHADCIKAFATSWKLLLLNAQLKDTVAVYVNILSLLEPLGSSDNGYGHLNASTNDDMSVLKERLSSFIISPRFQEYWVPVEISNVQLEQYCSSMLSNSTVLRLCSKSDPIGSLHDILISTQKCCDHPYIVNPSLRKSLLPENPSQDAALDMGVKASGKLQLLDKLLSEFRNQGLKVLILFQSIAGSGKDNLEFLLDDLLTWRFGKDSFEHVAVGGQPSKKHAALNKFNKESDRSFLLLERRACLPSIKLSSVDSVIILNSDWNPLNDLRALQKIIIDSKLKPIKVFRFYCSCTVEEKALVMAKNDPILDSTVPLNPSTKQMLLMWGSSYLFSRLDQFHRDDIVKNITTVSLGSSFVTDVFKEIVSVVKNDENGSQSKYISEVQFDGRCYLKNTLLLGEQRNQVQEGMPSPDFWMKLLEGKLPQWKYLAVSPERNRKRVDYSDDLSLPPDVEIDEPIKRRKDTSPRQAGLQAEKVKDMNKEHQGLSDMRLPAQDGRIDSNDQSGLLEKLKPTIRGLCKTLMLKDDVKRLAESFLEYVLNNHQVTREPETILQAFQISVCWTAAEVMEQKVDHRKSLEIAVEKMEFKCREQEADSVYKKMKLLMKIFLFRNLKPLKSSIDPASATDETISKSCVDISIGGLEKISNKEKDSFGYSENVKKICEKKIKKLKERQKDELVKFENAWQEKRAKLEDNYKVESAVIRYSHAKSTDVVEKLKILEENYAKKKEDLESQIYKHHKEFEARQQEERDGEQKKIAQLLELVKPVAQNEQLENQPSLNSIQLQTTEHDIDIPLNGDVRFHLSEKTRDGSENDIIQMDAILVRKENTPENNVGNGVSTTICCTPRDESRSLVSTSTKHQTSDENACQDLGDQVCQQQVERAVEEVCSLTESCHASLGGETPFVEPADSVPSNLPHDEEPTALPATEHSSDQLDNQPNEVENPVVLTENCNASLGGEIPLAEPADSVPSNLPHDQEPTALPATEHSSDQLNNQPNEVESLVVQTSCAQMLPQLAHSGIARVHGSHLTPLSAVPPTNSRMPPSYYSDPLQNEFDRIRKQIGETINAHEEMKLRLKSECEKEIEDLVAQIRKKYCVKLEEAESSFSLKKSELELNQNMVMMNKFLADAFRSKCTDYKADKAGAQGRSQKGMSSSRINIPLQLQPTARPLSSTTSFSMVPSTISPTRTIVNPFPTLESGMPTRPPLDRMARHETRAPAPHLQHLSVPRAMSSNNMQYSSVFPLQPLNNNHLASSSSSQIPDREPVLSLNATELLLDIARRNDAKLRFLSENLPPWPDNSQDHESWDLSQFERVPDVEQPAGDVVCLSDDD
ncbi:uncharacterized protein LOC141642771 isoform X2 [Silene latifolia]|uniref:uncharacterized protein LOC141642771 isoform X2 n=1 Tax=Silene latifolia TaxID=37657 RepID=UPI003D77D3E4